jgi:putative copper export protein
MLAGAVSIFSNSMVSHNTALSFLPSLAISLDWFHFMAVSIWLGGLFYISSILLMRIRLSVRKNGNIDGTVRRSSDVSIVHDTSYFLALLLPYFSLLATVSVYPSTSNSPVSCKTALKQKMTSFSSSTAKILFFLSFCCVQ